MMDDMEKERHRLAANTADLWAQHYHVKVLESEFPDEREFWQKREAHHRLECQLHLSVLEESQ